MPCRCDYFEPSRREIESYEVANHLVYLSEVIGLKPGRLTVAAAGNSPYGNVAMLDHMTAFLCRVVEAMTEEKLAKYVYNGRDPRARKLADWWDRRVEVDAKRAKAEAEKARAAEVAANARAKLTPEELKALGLKP